MAKLNTVALVMMETQNVMKQGGLESRDYPWKVKTVHYYIQYDNHDNCLYAIKKVDNIGYKVVNLPSNWELL